MSCVAAFSVDFWLQTNLFQSGVLWHLLLFLFDYDFTLEEGGVEKSDESNQQVSSIVVTYLRFGHRWILMLEGGRVW